MLEKKSSEEAHTSKTFKCGKPYVFAHKFLNSISVEYYISKNGFNCSFYYGTASVTADIVKVLIGPRFLGNRMKSLYVGNPWSSKLLRNRCP